MLSFRQRDKVLALLAGGATLADVAARTGVHRRMVHRLAKSAGLLPPPPQPKAQPLKAPKPKPRPRGPSAWQVQLALSMLRVGAPCVDAAGHAGIDEKTAARLARLHGLRVRPRGRQKGEAGVPLELRAAVLRLVAEGATLREAGAQVGVSRQRVFQWAQAEGVKVGRRRKRKTMAGAQVKPAKMDPEIVRMRGVSPAAAGAVEGKPDFA